MELYVDNKKMELKQKRFKSFGRMINEINKQLTLDNKVPYKFYVNGDLQSGYNTTTSPAQDVDLFHPTSSSIEIGYDRGHNSYHDGYIAEFNYVDGQQLDCGHFGEPDPGCD